MEKKDGRRFFPLVLWGSWMGLSVWAGAQPPDPEETHLPTPKEVSVDLHIGAEWLELPPVADDTEAEPPTLTQSVLRILRAMDPQTGKPYEESLDLFGCDPGDLRRAFRLEKKDFLLGEPITVEFRIALDGSGEWQEPLGGNYRARGRDDNFLFLMRHEDGTWERDPYAPIQGYMGGRASTYGIQRNQPQSYWFPVKRWCAIDRPGKYDLYCFRSAHGYTVVGQRQALVANLPEEVSQDHFLDPQGQLIDTQTGKPSKRFSLIPTWRRIPGGTSPLVEKIPAEVTGYAHFWNMQSVSDFARFPIVITEASTGERKQMVEHWTQIAESNEETRGPRGPAEAAKIGICLALQDDFLPLLETWLTEPEKASYVLFQGLAMRPSTQATALLLKADTSASVGALRYLHPDQVPAVIPYLIRRLTHAEEGIRSQAEQFLHRWTGQAFHRPWKGYHRQRPTWEEGRRMQPLWQEWWAQNRNDFRPPTQ